MTKLPEILWLFIAISISGPLRKHLESLKPRFHLSVTVRTGIGSDVISYGGHFVLCSEEFVNKWAAVGLGKCEHVTD